MLQRLETPCSLGLYCSSCVNTLLPVAEGKFCDICLLKLVTFNQILILFSGVLHRVTDECERLSALGTMRCASTAKACFCQCAGRQLSDSDSADSLLVVQSLTSLKALRAALRPICDNSLTGGSETVKPCKCVAVVKTNC